MHDLKPPMFVRPLTSYERKQLEASLRSRKAFTVRRCQILLSSSRREPVSSIARPLGCATQTVRNVIHDFQARGLPSLEEKAHYQKTVRPLLDESKCERLKALLHSPPRQFGKPTSLWTLDLVAEVAFEQGLVNTSVSREIIRRAIRRLGIKWKRAKNGITRPDPQYGLKKSKVDAEPLVMCCYGLLRRDTDKLLLRFVEGRPVSQVTTDFLEWVCGKLAEEGKRVMVVI